MLFYYIIPVVYNECKNKQIFLINFVFCCNKFMEDFARITQSHHVRGGMSFVTTLSVPIVTLSPMKRGYFIYSSALARSSFPLLPCRIACACRWEVP